MPSFGVIAKRLGEFATGVNQGRIAQDQLYRQENRAALDFSLKAGSAGLDPSQFTDDMYTKGNPFAGALKDKAALFLSPYEVEQATTRAEAAREDRKIAVDEAANTLKGELGILNAETSLQIAGMNNASKIRAAQIAAAQSARNAGLLAKGAASWGNMETRDSVVRSSVLRQMLSRKLITMDDIATDDDGNWLGVTNPDKADAYEKITNGFYQYLDQNPNAQAVDISPLVGTYIDNNAAQIEQTDTSSWYNPLDWVAPDTGLKVTGTLEDQDLSRQLEDVVTFTRSRNLQSADPEERAAFAKAALDSITATVPDMDESEVEQLYRLMLGDD